MTYYEPSTWAPNQSFHPYDDSKLATPTTKFPENRAEKHILGSFQYLDFN